MENETLIGENFLIRLHCIVNRNSKLKEMKEALRSSD